MPAEHSSRPAKKTLRILIRTLNVFFRINLHYIIQLNPHSVLQNNLAGVGSVRRILPLAV